MKKGKILILVLILLIAPVHFILASSSTTASTKTVSVKNTSNSLTGNYEMMLTQLDRTETIIQTITTRLTSQGVNTSILQSNLNTAKLKTSSAKTILANIKIIAPTNSNQIKPQIQSLNVLIKDSYTSITAATNIIKDIFKNRQTQTSSLKLQTKKL